MHRLLHMGDKLQITVRRRASAAALLAFLVSLVLLVPVGAAQAAPQYSLWYLYNAGSVQYAHRSGISVDSGAHTAYAEVRRSNFSTSPINWLGANARLYYGTAMCKQSGIIYNGFARVTQVATTSYGGCATGNAYGWASFRVYNGGGYNSFTGVQSPLLDDPSFAALKTSGAPDQFETNERGLTYGSAVGAASPAAEPQLIEVIANNGKVGYAYKSALDEGMDLKTPEEVGAWQASKRGKPTVIPVYLSDGSTKIGTFTHHPGVSTK